jgi:hypothetical protein
VDEFRRLYTSNEAGRVTYRCWLAFTSRTPDTLRRDDLADRLLLLPVDRIEADALRAERDFLHQADVLRGWWWSDLLTTLNRTVGAIRRGELQSRGRLRLADWESVGRIVARVEGREAIWDRFVDNLTGAQAEFLLEGDLIVDGLAQWLEDPANHGREVTARVLHEELTALLFGDRKPPRDWPASVMGFAKRLAAIRRELRAFWRVEWGRSQSRENRARECYQFWPHE